MHASGLTQLVGREEELEMLLRRWSKAKTGEGQVVLLSGEAGIGKSRITAALLERLATEPHTRLRYFCSPQHTDSAFFPIISQMERASGLAHDEAAQAKLDKLDAVLRQSFTPPQDAALLAEMLSLPNDGRYPTLELVPQQRRQKTLEALTAQLEGLSRSNPMLMIFEDVHWIDPTSLEALGRAVDRIRSLGVLLIVTHRPEFEAAWIGRPHVTALTINRLGEREIAVMIDGVTGNKLLPANIRQDIIERTDGIPLFAEEMTKAVLEAESEGDARKTSAAVPSSALAVPASLHASLMARLDRLGPAKDVAQIGAAIGREFSHTLLVEVARRPEAETASALDRLVAAGLLFRQGIPPHATYLFKHALVQDAAYGTLLREPRRALHARIAETLEGGFAEIAENQPEVLARHCNEAGLNEKAARFWGKAGRRSLERSALVEAVVQLTRALELIATLPTTPVLRGEEIKIQVALLTPLIHVKGHGAPETRQAAERARLLIEQAEARGETLQDPLLLFSVLYGLWVTSAIAFSGPTCRDLAAEFLAFAEKQGAAAPLVIAHRIAGQTFAFSGDLLRAQTHYDKGLDLYDPSKHRVLATQFGQDAAETLLSGRSWVMWILGYPDAALADADRALRIANEVNHAATLMHALSFAPFPLFQCGNYEKANEIAEKLFVLADEKSSLLWKSFAAANEGCIAALNGRPSRAAQKITAAITDWRSTGATIVASGTEKQLESHRREITALFCDLRGFTGFSESADPEDVMTLLREYHEAIGASIIKYSGTLERYAGDGVMVVFNDPVPVENPALQAVLMALEMRDAIGALTETWRRWGHEIGFGIGIAHGFATLGTIGFEGRFDYAAIGTVSNVASRLCDEAKPGQILISPRVLTKVENAVKVEPVGEFELKGIRRPLAAYNVVAASPSKA